MKLSDFPSALTEIFDSPLAIHPDAMMTGKAKRQAVGAKKVQVYTAKLNDKDYIFITMVTKDDFFEVHFQEKTEKLEDSGMDVPSKVFSTAIDLFVKAYQDGMNIRISAPSANKKKVDLYQKMAKFMIRKLGVKSTAVNVKHGYSHDVNKTPVTSFEIMKE
jgi:hypothetical protein